MPFITQERRKIVDKDKFYGLDVIQPGDRCYFFYSQMVKDWKANPHWTTAHEIYKEMVHLIEGEKETDDRKESDDDDIAYQLAWQVFFAWYVIPYEREKEKLNGTI